MIKQELYCHECSQYVQFDMDEEQNGNLIIKCPNCGHEHCRIVKNGTITEERWDSRNIINIGNYTTACNVTSSTMSTFFTYTTSNITSNVRVYPNASTSTSSGNPNTSYSNTVANTFLYGAWMNTLTV